MERKRIGQAGIRGARVVGKYPAFSKGVSTECVVIAVRYIDDTRNISKQFTEYDVKDLRTGQIYPNVRRVDSVAGMDDGEENVLRPAQKLIGAVSTVFDPKIAQLSQSDGDRVQVSFSYGAQHTPVITDVLPHPKLTYGTTREQGHRKFSTHKGTSVESQKDGTYQIKRGDTAITLSADETIEIKRGDTAITLNADETIEVKHKSGATLRFLDAGDIEMTPAQGRDVFVGKEGATENMVLGQRLKVFLNTMITALLTATYSTALGPTSPMLPPAQVVLQQLQQQLDLLLSQMAFVEEAV